MDLFGKILVLANFALSLMMAAVGGAVLYYRVDWSDAPADAATGAPAGELVARIAEVKKLQALVTPADAAWREARASLLAQEERRKGDEVWYAAELEYLKTGDASKKPILAVVFDKGVTTPDPANNGRPQMAPVADRFGKPLQSLVWYNQQQGVVNGDTTTVLENIMKSEFEDTELTLHLLGPKGVPDLEKKLEDQISALKIEVGGDEGRKAARKDLTELIAQFKKKLEDLMGGSENTRGLLERAKDEASKQDAIADENDLVFRAEGQERANSQLLLLRKKSLEARVKELGKTGATAAGQ